MAFALTPKLRYMVDQAFPWLVRTDYPHRGSDVLFPLSSVLYGALVTTGALFTLNVAGGFIRDLNGNVVEVLPQSAVTGGATFAAPASAHALIVSVYWDTAAAAVVAHNGATSLTAAVTAEPDPANVSSYTGVPTTGLPTNNPTASTLVLLATAEVHNGDTTFTRISNLARRIR